MVEAVIHFLIHVRVVLPELSDCVGLDLFDAVLLPLELIAELLSQVGLPLEAALLLRVDRILYFVRLLLQQFQYFPLFLDASVSLRLQILKRLLNARVYRIQLRVERFDAVVALFLKEVLQSLHSIIASLDLTVLVVLLVVELCC